MFCFAGFLLWFLLLLAFVLVCGFKFVLLLSLVWFLLVVFYFILFYFYFFFSVCFFVFFPDVKSKLDRKVLEGHGTDPIYYISTTTVTIPIKHGLVII